MHHLDSNMMPGHEMSAAVMSRRKLAALAVAALAGFAVLDSLGVWQLQRLAWKRELIERVDAARPCACL